MLEKYVKELLNVLEEMLSVQQELLETARSKTTAMVNKDVEKMEELIEKEGNLLEKIESLESRRRNIIEKIASETSIPVEKLTISKIVRIVPVELAFSLKEKSESLLEVLDSLNRINTLNEKLAKDILEYIDQVAKTSAELIPFDIKV